MRFRSIEQEHGTRSQSAVEYIAGVKSLLQDQQSALKGMAASTEGLNKALRSAQMVRPWRMLLGGARHDDDTPTRAAKRGAQADRGRPPPRQHRANG